ncbi:M28 family metallopeptidase [Coralloluteibacterium thermophilus]|uniref:M28 family metallopeptidase n=1 Tax=Coralloluteibacterium thermophilum TaxID=2707049 RepID=A0ABV9NIJ3_9GAMM
MRPILPFLLLATATASATVLAADPVPGGGIDAERFARHMRAFTSDAFAGRAPATEGEERTVAYLAEAFREAGLEPAGEDGGWTQRVQLARSEIDGPVSLRLTVGGETHVLTRGEEIAIETLHPAPRVELADVPLVFVGYGVHAPELGWDDYAGLDLAGRIAVVLINDPDFETPEPGLFGGRAITYYGRWSYKYEEAARRGATGVLIVHETAPAAYGWETVRNGRAGPQYDIVRPDADRAHLRIRGWIQRDLAVALFRDAGLDFEALKARAQRQGFRPVPIEGATLSAAFDVKHDRIVSRNVLGVLPGASRPQETVIVSGHWDHFGVGEPDAEGNRIYRGAVDNATALASMIELARVFAAGERPARSLLFFAPTAEESGLLGARHYVANPLRPLETTAAVVNIEMWSPDGPTRDISTWGIGRVSLERDIARAAALDGRVWSQDPNLEAGFFYRADHFAFAQAGVPAITVGPGSDMLDGGVEAGRAARADYFARRYHQPADVFDDSWDLRGPVADVTTVYRLVRDIAESGRWPEWDPDAEFRAEREKSAAARR